jgi:hypothetical protein
MATQSTSKTGPDLKPYEDKIIAALHEADTKLATFETKAKAEREHATVAAVDQVKVARKKLEEQLKTLGTVSAAHIQRAKSDIDAASAALKASLDELGKKFASAPEKAAPAASATATPAKAAPVAAAPAAAPEKAPTAKATSEKK